MSAQRSTAERFWAKVDTSGDCWLWTAAKNRGGYGWFAVDGRTKVGAHRWSFEATHGAIPPGMDIDHICRVRHCVRPDHLQAVTRSANAQNRGGATRQSGTRVRGVSYDESRGQYRVRAVVAGRFHRGGSYDSLEEAARAASDLRRRVMANSLADQPSRHERTQGSCGESLPAERREPSLGA